MKKTGCIACNEIKNDIHQLTALHVLFGFACVKIRSSYGATLLMSSNDISLIDFCLSTNPIRLIVSCRGKKTDCQYVSDKAAPLRKYVHVIYRFLSWFYLFYVLESIFVLFEPYVRFHSFS